LELYPCLYWDAFFIIVSTCFDRIAANSGAALYLRERAAQLGARRLLMTVVAQTIRKIHSGRKRGGFKEPELRVGLTYLFEEQGLEK
jgi:hypothetical protein